LLLIFYRSARSYFMKLQSISAIETPYEGISNADYQIEKRRLQVELLRIQEHIIQQKLRVAVVFEGRDAAGKGSTIKRFTENLIPSAYNIHTFGIPTQAESKYWFNRYQRLFPEAGQITFFDRSWYTRALIEPTMHYCTRQQYEYFMNKVLNWEHKHIENGLLLIKFYLSVDEETQLMRFSERLNNPLTYWKFSENDLAAREKWSVFTHYKEQMFHYTSSELSPWVVINSNKKREARLTSILYFIRAFGNTDFEPLTGENVLDKHSIKIDGINFKGLSRQQQQILKHLVSDKEPLLEN